MSNERYQLEVSQFVEREVLACQSSLVDELLAKEIFSWDDIENIYSPENEEETQEIFEWWLVSSWIADKLKEKGEPILDNDYGIWWGRCCSGQAVYMDGVMQEIYNDLLNT